MQNKSYISALEQKLLVGFFVFISLWFYFHLAVTKIENCNKEVKIEQIKKNQEANGNQTDGISFGLYDMKGRDLVDEVFWLNFLLIPLIIFLLWKRKFSYFIFSTIINTLTTLSVILWNFRNSSAVSVNEIHITYNSPYGYFGLLSHITGFVLAIASTIFVILQLAIITRFVFEKNQAKISFR